MKLKRFIAMFLVVIMCIGCVSIDSVDTKAASGTYWIKVNKQANVATAYKKSGKSWKPVKAMLVSCGGKNTPAGTYNTTAKYRWHTLQGPSYGQYCTRIVRGILFHSVWYYQNGNKKSQAVKEFNKLGQTASHGCVRVSTEDAKWIYNNCKVGTKVTIYSSSNPGPLGKPAAYKMPSSAGKMNWDPTDASSSNPYYKTLPVLTQKYKTIQYGDTKANSAKKLVTAKQKKGGSLKKLTTSVTKYSSSKKKYVKAKYSVKSEGTYKIKYTAVGKKGVSLTKTFTFKVKDTKAPTVTVTKTKDQIDLNTKNATKWLKSAKMANGTNRKSSAKVYIKAPGSKKYVAYTYANAKTYKFNKKGNYSIYYVATNKNKTSVTKQSKTVVVTVVDKSATTTSTTTEPTTATTESTTGTTETSNTNTQATTQTPAKQASTSDDATSTSVEE